MKREQICEVQLRILCRARPMDLRCIGLLCIGLLYACAESAGTAARWAQLPPGAPRPLPALSVLGCVESEELGRYVERLNRSNERALERALRSMQEDAQDGMASHILAKRSIALPQALSTETGQTISWNGKRWLVTGKRSAEEAPEFSFLKRGEALHPLVYRPHGIAVAMPVCGYDPKGSSARPPALPQLQSFAVQLHEGEEPGAPLEVEFERYYVRPETERQHTTAEEKPPHE